MQMSLDSQNPFTKAFYNIKKKDLFFLLTLLYRIQLENHKILVYSCIYVKFFDSTSDISMIF